VFCLNGRAGSDSQEDNKWFHAIALRFHLKERQLGSADADAGDDF
jgi:hypothetical protein